jgi:acetylornithine deacetylase/succinyl-diaminopimelate desuccinylase-like protein
MTRLKEAYSAIATGLVHLIDVDATEPESYKECVQKTIEAYGRLDLLVNNVGGGTFGQTLSATTLDDWNASYALNTTSVFFTSQAALPYLTESKGTIINFSSVLASRPAKNGRPHVLLYAHHDVQPPGDASQWLTPAFEPTAKDGRIYGRGAADDKAGVVAHLTAIETLKAIAGDDFDLGISIFIEGEEEAGSRTFRAFLDENKEKLAADVIIVADSMNWSPEVPALTVSLRGMVSQEFTIRTMEHAVHSGMFGGAIPDAILPMIKVLASLHDDKGNVAVEGLKTYKFEDLPYTDANLRADSGLLPEVSQIGEGGIMDRIWGKPALTIIGIDVPSVAMSSNTLLPTASAKVSYPNNP